ncbi:hypothetical protein [Arenimonas oryziterrae]|uniref:Dicarboxylate transport domain-containing protein n=1 Tax=Arenimonas oryziterrae DSM 21050 = YC6267 TaxID=1121015 RepID=A0A091AQ46_9GAMM|nr:hypothetical protein [Arenimonas oryziterrae]KFN41129.1 hypothetical protein N789_04385 [Arenimonas oryziterrae DSM 21050 = YC6267]
MRTTHWIIKLLWLSALCAAAGAQAKELEARIAKLSTGAGSLQGVQLSLDWPDGGTTGTMRLRAQSLDFPTLSYRARNVDWQCPLARTAAGGWRCVGPVRANGSGGFPLALDISAGATLADLRIGKSRIQYQALAAAPDRSRVLVEKIPVDWLKAYLASLWAEGRWTQGSLSGQVDVLTPKAGPFEVRTDLTVDALGLETPTGWLAAAGLKGRLLVDYRDLAGKQSVDTRLTLRGGEFLAQNFYAQLPSTPVDIRVLAEHQGTAPWRLPVLSWQDPGVFEASGKATLAKDASISDLDLALDMGNLTIARDRYLSGFLAPAGFPELLLTGKVVAGLQLRGGELDAMQANFSGVNAIDDKARFTIAGVDGELRWNGGASPVQSRFGWSSGALYGIGLGQAKFAFTSKDGELRLDSPVAMEMLEGRITLDHMRWQAPKGEIGARFQFGLGMQQLDLGSLSQRLGWPPFTGTIGGKIPSARYADSILTLDGGLRMDVFGGSVTLADLVMERPLGIAPTLSADVELQDMDLEPMTKAFDFGSMTGRLDGHINQLRLVDWSPVAFDAYFETDRSFKGKRRLSQRAVKDITNVGGGGLVAGLQAQVLQIFDDFGYERLGIGCKLKDNVCQMTGLGSAGDGYIIVAGSGLPRIQVVGFRRRVDWPTLVSRLEAATEGQTPVIQ